MKPSTHITILSISLLLAILVYSIVNPNIFISERWKFDYLADILHNWFMGATAYYIYNYLLAWLIQKSSAQKAIYASLAITCTIVFTWILTIDLLYYKVYYRVRSLSAETTLFEFDLPIILLVLILSSLYFYQKHYPQPIAENPVNPKFSALEGWQGSKKLLFTQSEVALLYSAEKVVWLYTNTGEQCRTDYTLSQLLSLLPNDVFFRINRQAIVSREAIAKVEPGSYQKLQLSLRPSTGFSQSLTISKYTAPSFRKWLTNSGQN